MAEPHQTNTIKSFSCPLKIRNMSSLLIVSSLRRDTLKCADNRNSVWFIFSPFGYPVYMNIKHEMQLMALASISCQAMTLPVCVCAHPVGFHIYLDCFLPRLPLQKVFMFLEGETLCRLWSRVLVIFESKCGGNIPNILTASLQRKLPLC